MKFRDIIQRITGFSTPVFGVSWSPPISELNHAKRLLLFLEDRRVLFNPTELEIPEHCVDSIIEIRHFLTDALQELESGSELGKSIRAMRAACRKFMDTVGADRRLIRHGGEKGHFASWYFNAAVGELRGTFGLHLAIIAAAYGLDVESPLSEILPWMDEKD